MSTNSTIKTFTAIDIEKYHKGQLTHKQMHEMEKAALDDPFLADALEGYAVEGVNAPADIAELKNRMAQKQDGKDRTAIVPLHNSSFPWLRAAVLIVLIGGAAFMIYQFASRNKQNELAVLKKNGAQQSVPAANSNADRSLVPADSITTSAEKEEKPASITTTQQAYTVATDQAAASDSISYRTLPAYKNMSEEKRLAENKETELKAGISARLEEIAKSDTIASIAFNKQNGYSNLKIQPTLTQARQKDNVYHFQTNKQLQFGDVLKDAQNTNGGLSLQKNRLPNVFRGRVTDPYNNALPFANVTNRADNVGTYSDAKGYFTLISSDSILNVQVRSVGFENNNIQLQNTVADNQVVMQEDKSVSEIVLSKNKTANSARPRTSTMVLEEPEPIDGWQNYDVYLANNLNVPETFKNKQSNGGEVKLSFEVNKNGDPINITVEKSLCESCDREAIRLLKEGPKWKRKLKKKRTSLTISF